MMLCSFPEPHHPFAPPGRYWEMYQPGDVPLPETFGDPHDRSVPHIKDIIAERGTPAPNGIRTWAPTEEQLRQALAAEYGTISMLDDKVGELLGTLDELGLRENTVVVFLSDHGDMAGDHGLLLKEFIHYQGIVRIPLMISGPGIAAGRTQSLVSMIDIAPTVLDLAGAPHYHGMQGHSLLPVIDDHDASVRDRVLIEEDRLYFPMARFDHGPRMRTLVTQDARFTVYQGAGYRELFDLSADPGELDNLAEDQDARGLRAAMTEQLLDAVIEHEEPGFGDGFSPAEPLA
jgi:arylsulfatase A-like enzyme